MKVRVQYISEGEDEVVIKCRSITDEINNILQLFKEDKKIVAELKGKIYFIDPREICYCESVDNTVFVYTETEIYKTTLKLRDIEEDYSKLSLFRCSKSMIININQIISLKSEMGNKIDAELVNGEHVIISRRYAKELRIILKSKSGGSANG